MYKKVAFIGVGNMGGAVFQSAVKVIGGENIIIADPSVQRTNELSNTTGCSVACSNIEAAEAAQYIFLCVKPQVLPAVVGEIIPALNGSEKVIVSIAAGVKIAAIRELLGGINVPIIRIMPNSPALIGKGLMLVAADGSASEAELAEMENIISSCGNISRIDEKLIDQGTAVASCSPAFVYMFIEAMADGGVALGLTRQQAVQQAASAVLGSAAMVLETGKHPGELKDGVCSPAGSTIAGVAELERRGFRGAVVDAIIASYNRNVELGNSK